MELERRYEELDLHVDGDVQDPEGKSLHTYLVHLPATQFPELDPALKAPMDAELWSTDVELFRVVPSWNSGITQSRALCSYCMHVMQVWMRRRRNQRICL